MAAPGRNDPCPCGSGKKFKRCCGSATSRSPEAPSTETTHDLDRDLVARIQAFGRERYRAAFDAALAACPGDERLDPAYLQIVAPYMAYHARIGGVALVELFLEAEAGRLDIRERHWLEANLKAWLSIWEVLEVDPGKSLLLRDLLSGERRRVIENLGTRGLRPRHALCARVVDMDGVSLLVGSHPRPLGPEEADGAARGVRRALRVRRKHLPVELLREEGAAVVLEYWQEAVDAFDRRPLPQLQNTDGDRLELTEDRYDLSAGAREAVEERLAELEGFSAAEPGESRASGTTSFSVTRRGNPRVSALENTVVGRVVVSDTDLCIETNSEARADALRRRVEDACGRRIVHRGRTRKDAQDLLASSIGRKAAGPKRTSGLPPEIEDGLVLDMKQKTYARWPDEPVPALGGLTPREAAKKSSTRHRLDVLLKSLESMEAGEPVGRRFDVASLRRLLGLDPE